MYINETIQKNTVQTIWNTVNTRTLITKTPTHTHTHTLQNPHTHARTHTHTHTHTHTLQNPHITKPTHTHTHTLQNPHIHTHTHSHPHITQQVKTTTVQDTHQIKQSQYNQVPSV